MPSLRKSNWKRLFCEKGWSTLLKERLWHRCFSVNFGIFLRIPALQNTSRRLFCFASSIKNNLKQYSLLINQSNRLHFCMLMINLYHTNSGVFICPRCLHLPIKSFWRYNYKTFIINLWICRISKKKSFKVTWKFTNSPEVAAQRCFVKKVFLKTWQDSQENTCARVSFLIKLQVWGQSLFLNKVAGLRPATLLKRRLWRWCFSVNFSKLLRTLFLKVHRRWLLLAVSYILW